MQTLTGEDVKKAFEADASKRFSTRLERLEWLADDPYEATGERLPHVFHVALHLRKATPGDIDAGRHRRRETSTPLRIWPAPLKNDSAMRTRS